MNHQAIKRAAVIGAGTMGSQIAAVIANSNIPVLLLDIIPKGTNEHNILANKAIERIKESKGLLHNNNAENIRAGNIEDDLEKLGNVDWVIECVPEDQKIKKETYDKICKYLKETALVSSNTSTIPLHILKKGLKSQLQKQLCITHFFNPPTKMPLLELITDQDNNPQTIQDLKNFADKTLGKNVVKAKDTPGFIANRIGMFWLLCAMEEAKNSGISIELADSVMHEFGFPKTGIFGLADLIGLKLIPDIAKSICQFLPDSDEFCKLHKGLELIDELLKTNPDGSKVNFYESGGEHKKAFDLKSKIYNPAKYPDIKINNWHEFLKKNSPESIFAFTTFTRFLGYAAQIAPNIADDIIQIDTAMRDGFGWKYGPFEMIDLLGGAWLSAEIEKQHGLFPILLCKSSPNKFYKAEERKGISYLSFDSIYRKYELDESKWTLANKTAGEKPILSNESAKLWDIGDGIACFEITTKMHVIDELVLGLLMQAIDKVESDFKGLVIGHDSKDFSAGLDLNIVLESAKNNNWKRVKDIIKQGQDCMVKMHQSSVPVVMAISGYTIGGACEMAMQVAAVQAHSSTKLGLVETNIGVIPAWGGTKEHLFNAIRYGKKDADKIVDRALLSFHQIANAEKSSNADNAFKMGLLCENSRVSFNRERLLPDAKALCLEIAQNYTPQIDESFEAPVEELYYNFSKEIDNICEQEPYITKDRKKTLSKLAEVLSGYAAVTKLEKKGIAPLQAGWNKISESQILESSSEAFMLLVKEEQSIQKIKAILKKP